MLVRFDFATTKGSGNVQVHHRHAKNMRNMVRSEKGIDADGHLRDQGGSISGLWSGKSHF